MWRRITSEGAIAGMLSVFTIGITRLCLSFFVFKNSCDTSVVNGHINHGHWLVCMNFNHFAMIICGIVSVITIIVSMFFSPEAYENIQNYVIKWPRGIQCCQVGDETEGLVDNKSRRKKRKKYETVEGENVSEEDEQDLAIPLEETEEEKITENKPEISQDQQECNLENEIVTVDKDAAPVVCPHVMDTEPLDITIWKTISNKFEKHQICITNIFAVFQISIVTGLIIGFSGFFY